MRFAAFVLTAAAGALAAPEGPPQPIFSCGAPRPDAAHLKQTQKLADEEAAFAASGNITTRQVITVDTYFHVVATGNALIGGLLSIGPDASPYHLNTLNQDFLPHGIQFANKGIDYTINPTWANGGNEAAMKTALRKGTYQTLNIYFLRQLEDRSLGACYLPLSGVTPSDEIYTLDGCTIKFTTVPGGSETGYNLGHTTAHEVGHWMGLYHTFENGCYLGGDMVSYTPYEAFQASGCQIGRDTCPQQPGTDPVTNYMDYSLE
ncbi:hypothetical protein NEMBOFW57_004547 [Staphylotrichum longicolle]|uniref:Peptidase M43 pregnancy-associated plasma-A domain-containing protein n=1 Tax=Staphylotrichum longicolle TaxID=669026 RepID=A0AAD4FBW8_9PEZI|nr:hypothetical protein NEMBOFW57_004547 [Staphylotrichum longicolle]